MFLKRMFWCPGLLLLQWLCGIASTHGNATDIKKSGQDKDTQENPASSSVATVSEFLRSSFYTTYSLSDESAILSTTSNLASVKKQVASDVNFSAKTEKTLTSLPNIEVDELDSYLFKTISIIPKNELSESYLRSSFPSSSVALTVDSSSHRTDSALPNYSSLLNQVPLTSPSISRDTNSPSSSPSELAVTRTQQLSTESIVSSISEVPEESEEMAVEAAENSETSFSTHYDSPTNTPRDYEIDESLTAAQTNRTHIRSSADRSLKDLTPLLDSSGYISSGQIPLEIQSSFASLNTYSHGLSSIPKTAREILVTETPKLSLRRHRRPQVTESVADDYVTYFTTVMLTSTVTDPGYISSIYVSPQKQISSTLLDLMTEEFGQVGSVSSPSSDSFAESSQSDSQDDISLESESSTETEPHGSDRSDELNIHIQNVFSSSADHQNIFQKRNGFIFIEPETETERDIQLEGSLEDSGKNMDTHSNLQFSSTAILQEPFTSFPTFSSSQIETAAAEIPLEEEPDISVPDTIERRSDSGEEGLNFRHSNLHSKPTYMHVKRLPAQNKITFGKSDPYKSDFLIVVTPSSQRSSKEFEMSTGEPSPALNEEEVSQIVSILTANFEDTSTEDTPSSKSVVPTDVTHLAMMKNKTSRNDSPQFDDIISGIIQLLAGDVHVVRPPPNFQLAHPPVPRPPRPTSSRINNRGPPTAFPPTKTVVVFSQPPHHLNVRPRPPVPAPQPPARPKPSVTKTNNFQTVPVVTHLINVPPARPDKAGAPTSSVIHLYKPLLNPMEGDTYGHGPVGDDTVISVLKTIPVVSVSAAKSNTVVANSSPDGLIETSKKTSAPAEEHGHDSSQTSSGSSPTSSTEDSSGPFVYDDYYYDLSESEEDLATYTNSSNFEILKDPTTENANKPSDTKSSNSNAPSSSSSQEKSQAILISNPGSAVLATLSNDKSSGDKYLYVSTKILPKGSHIPSGPITDWVPFLERPSSNPHQGSVKVSHTNPSKVPEIVIITEPTMFDLTVTKALTGVLPPFSTSNSSQILEIIPSRSVQIQHTKLANIIDSEDIPLSFPDMFMTSYVSSYPPVISTAADKTIHATVRMKPSPTVNQPHQTASLSPSEPEIVYGRPSSSQDRPISPLRVDNLSKYRHNSFPSDTISKTQLSYSETAWADKDTTTLFGKASVKPKITPPPVNSTSISSVSAISHQTQHNTGGSPLLGRPIVVPVDIEEVRPYVGAINPPRQGSRPNSGQRPPPGFPGSPPGFPGPPLLGSGNVQVAQAGVNVAEDTRGRPSVLRPSQTSRPPLIRTHPRLRTNTPLVRIDTCIVGDDSTCDLQMNETCKTEHGVSSCQCRPGFSRSFARGPCQPIVSVMLSLKVDRFGEQRISFNPRYQDPNSEEYRLMEFEAKQALSSLFSYTAFSRNFVSATVNKFYSIGGRLIINATIQLEEKESTRVQSLRLQMRQEVVQAINSRGQNIGDSRLYVEGPLNPVPAIEDVNECTESNLNDCSENGYCQNIFGTYLCKCKVGYLDSHPLDERKSGRKCSACSVDYCSNHGHCYVENGQKLCRCRGNYIGSRCEIDSEVLGVALGASLAAIIIIVLTLVCLCVWNRRWKREQQKTEAMSARSVNSAQTYSYLNKMSNLNTYRLTMEDRMRWAHIADVVGNVYVQPEAGGTPMQSAMVQASQSAYPTMNRCHSPSSDETTWYSYNTTRPRSRAANCHSQSPVNGSYYDTDFSTRETYVGPNYAPVSRFVTPNVMRNYYS